MLFLLLALVVGRHVLLAKLSSNSSYGELSAFATRHGATLRPLDPYSKRGLYYRIVDNETSIPDSTTDDFTVESVTAYVSHSNNPYIELTYDTDPAIPFAYDAQLGTHFSRVRR
jgi:hypothetical protein